MSAPAAAWETETRARRSSVASLSTSPFFRMPQWPCSVYSHMQTSVMTTMSGTSFLRSRTARCTAPSSSHASLPVASLLSGIPKRITPPTPTAAARSTSRSNSSGEVCATPGIEPIAFRSFVPLRTNSGSTSCDGCSEVSRTRFRKALVLRSRRGLYSGKEAMNLFGLRSNHARGAAKLHQQASCPARAQLGG